MHENVIEARAALYFAISEGFKEPSGKFVEDAANGIYEIEIKEAFQILGHMVDTEGLTLEVREDDYETLKEHLLNQFYTLFKGPFPPYVVPVESVYKPWAKGDCIDASVRDSKGYIMGDSAVAMLRRYALDDIEVPTEFSCFPDHITLLMEYGGLLCIHGTESAQRAFILEHLDWIGELRNEIYALTNDSFYRRLADVCFVFSKLELRRFEMEDHDKTEVA